MKYDCTNEFDLDLIYQKLTAQSTTQMVKASCFFEQQKSSLLDKFQNQLAKCTPIFNKR